MHLMSLISPVDHDMAVVYSPLLPVPFREWLLDRGIHLVEVPDEEFDSMGTNVLALAPRRCLMLAGNPRTRAALERAGADVIEYEGTEISVKGAGGPTCLTRPLERADRETMNRLIADTRLVTRGVDRMRLASLMLFVLAVECDCGRAHKRLHHRTPIHLQDTLRLVSRSGRCARAEPRRAAPSDTGGHRRRPHSRQHA